jgi:hypothetical protein
MGRYIVIYHAPTSVPEQMANATPDDMQSVMGLWMAWAEKCGDALIDMGTPLGEGQG